MCGEFVTCEEYEVAFIKRRPEYKIVKGSICENCKRKRISSLYKMYKVRN